MGPRLQIGPDEEGSRLDRVLLRRLGPSLRGRIMRLIRRGNVRVNGKRSKPETRLHAGDVIFLPASLRQLKTADSSFRVYPGQWNVPMPEIPILYEDEDLVVVNKPAGVVVHGGSGHRVGLVEILRHKLGPCELRLAHRLDRDTSGCLLLVKRLEVLRHLSRAFHERSIQKTYLAWVAGHPYPHSGRLQHELAKGLLRGGERMVAVREGGKSAVTDYQVIMLAEWENWPFSLLALQPQSGRTHQLRVQLQASGHAILGDRKYGRREDNRRYRDTGGKGMALHAWRFRFHHPQRDEVIEVRAPWPEQWRTWFRLNKKSFTIVGG